MHTWMRSTRTTGRKVRWTMIGAVGVLAVAATVIAAVQGVFSPSPAAHAAVIQANPISPQMLTAMTSGRSLQISLQSPDPALQVATPQATAEQVALSHLPPNSQVLGVSLANAAIPFYGGQPQLVWLISADPAGGLHSVHAPTRAANYYVAIVSANNGNWLMASSGRSPQLPDLPSIPASP